MAALPASTVHIELAGESGAEVNPGFDVGALPNPDYFRRWRRSEPDGAFRYSFTRLPAGGGPYWIRLSVSESCPVASTMRIRWGSYDGDISPTLTALPYSICSDGEPVPGRTARTGTIGPVRVDPVSNQIHLLFEAIAGRAVVSTIEIGTTPTSFFLVVPADLSRHRQNLVARYQGGPYETVLGRLGSRYNLDLAPQRLGFRSSPMGTWADDLSDFVIGVQVGSATPRVLPLTDRYPPFPDVVQSLTLTSARLSASDAALGLGLNATFRAPFYPQDETTSITPAFLLDLEVAAPGPARIILARPVPYDVSDTVCSCAPGPLTATAGVRWGSVATFGDQSRVLTPTEGFRVDEAIALLGTSAGTLVTHAVPSGDCSQFLPCFAPASDPNPSVFRGRDRGWVGLTWEVTGTASARLVLAGVADGLAPTGEVLRVSRPEAQAGYAFRYRSSIGDVSDVVALAATRADEWVARSVAFDAVTGPQSFDLATPGPTEAARNLLAYAFQSYLVNTWWGERVAGTTGPEEWFSVWEGTCCFFHSTLDVAYNDSQVLLAVWPELLGMQLDEWPLFTRTDIATGQLYPMHDMGAFTSLDGQAYPFDMPVEESANYLLLLYAYWRSTGDAARLTARWDSARAFARYMAQADTNGNGFPDRGTVNTIDQGSPAISSSKDQIYLGVKSASAAQAMLEMAPAVLTSSALPDVERDALVAVRHRVDQTLYLSAWRGDHFAATLDPTVPPAERDAASIYAANGLLHLLQGGGGLPLDAETFARVRTDIATATNMTMGPAGSVHSSVGNSNAWFSQNFWRDDVALYLGATWSGGDFLSLLVRYWDQQVDFARRLDGAWWDVVVYGGSFTPSTAASSGSGGDFKAASVTGYGQSLGYYPRGATIFGLLPSVLGVSIDRPSGVLGIVGPARTSVRVPLLALGSWGPGPVTAPPVGSWTQGRFSVSPVPLALTGRDQSVPALSVPSSFSPDGDGAGDTLVGSAATSPPSRLSQSVASERSIRVDPVAGSVVAWDGRLGGGAAEQAPYRVCVIPDEPDTASVRLGSCSTTWVNLVTPEPARTWYLAEGSTLHGFEEFVLVQNPGDAAATVSVTYQTPSGPVPRAPINIPARSRSTIRVNDDIAADVSVRLDSDVPVVAERAMYLSGPEGTRTEGHAVLGVTAPRSTWYLAEGSTQHGFDEYILVQNPQATTALATITFSLEGGGSAALTATVPPASRFTLYANDVVTGDVSTRVDATVPVIVERAMYWGGSERRQGAHAATAVSAPSRFWFLAEGTTGFGFDEYVLLQNPGDTFATVQITYDLRTGPVAREPLVLAPRSRTTIHVNDEVVEQDVSARLVSDIPVIAERAMYFGGPSGSPTKRTGGHVTQGTTSPSTVWRIAEGTTAHGFDEYVLIQNPGTVPASVSLTSQPASATPFTRGALVPPGSRVTIYANESWHDQDLSILVVSDVPVVVERAMYFGGADRRSGGTGTVVAR